MCRADHICNEGNYYKCIADPEYVGMCFKYQKDKWIKAYDFSDDKYRMCAPGIHFFVSKKKAIAY